MASEVIKLNLIPKGEMPVFHVSQFDNGRTITCELFRGEDEYPVPNDITVELHCRKADNNIVTLPADNTSQDNVVKFTSTTQLTACYGKNLCEVALKGDDDYLIGTLNFILEVEKDPLQGGIQSTSEIHDLTQQIEDITEEIIGDNYYNKTETDSLLADKLNVWQLKPYPTIGTGIEVAKVFTGGDSEHGAYSYVANTRIQAYTMTETDNLLSEKADASDVYTKAQIEDKLADKASITYVDGEISAVDAVLIDMQTDLDRKADASDVYTKAQVDSALALKANAADVYTKQEVDNIILDIMPVDTASGAIATFNTQLAAPLVSVIADITATGGNGTPDNPNPISGYTEANITRCGVNLMHVNSRVSQTTAQVIYTSDDNYIEMNGTKYGGTYADLSTLTITLPAGTYYLKAFEISGTATNAPSITAYNGSDLTANILNNERTLTLSASTTFRFRFALWTDNAVYTNYKIGIAISTESGISDFTEYNGTTVTIAFGQTVYGGVLDVTMWKLTVTHYYKSLGDLNWSYNSGYGFYTSKDSSLWGDYNPKGIPNTEIANLKCDIYEVDTYQNVTGDITNFHIAQGTTYMAISDNRYTDGATFKTAMSGHYIAYELATPFDIDLTPEVISAIVGTNNVFADCGNIEVKFKTTIQDYIDSKIGG